MKGAKVLWDSLPSVYRQCAVRYTGFWAAAMAVIVHSKYHHAVGKETGQTNHAKRLNNTFRQRISPLVSETLDVFQENRKSYGYSFITIMPLFTLQQHNHCLYRTTEVLVALYEQ